MSGTIPPTTGATADPRVARSHVFRRLLKNPLALATMLFLVVVVLASVFAPLIAHNDPNLSNINDVLAKPGGKLLLGGDGAGRDVWARLIYGGRFTLAGALLATAVAAVLGIVSGLIAGYYGKRFEAVSSWIVSLLMALPGIVVLLAARAVLGPSIWLAMAIFGVLLAPAFYRLVFAAVTSVRNELYVDAARVSGVGDARIIARHILTVVRAPIIIQASIVASIAIAIQAGLDFLGLGDPTIPTWGNLLNDAFTNLYTDPTLLIWPTLIIGLTCISLNLFANALRDELERSGSAPKRRGRRAVAAESTTAAPGEQTIVHPETADAATKKPVLLHIDKLAVGYGQPDGSIKKVVQDVSVIIRRGEVHGLIGESGSGKTQTAWSVLRLLPAGGEIVGGTISFDGEDLAKASPGQMTKLRGRRIAYIPQEPMSNLDPSFTIGSQLVEPMRVTLGLSRADAKAKAIALLTRVGIPNPERTFAAYPHEVSGGMAQRVLIAGAVSCEPDLLIADEPTTALDVTVQAEILDLLREIQSELGVGVLLVTHNFGVVADLCDRVSVMQNGRIVESGPVRSIFAGPKHPYTQSLFDAIFEDGAARGPLDLAADRHTASADPVGSQS